MAGPGWGHPEETLDSTLGVVLWKQAETGPRPHKEPHLTKGAPTQGLCRDSPFPGQGGAFHRSVVGDGRQGQSQRTEGGWGPPTALLQGIQGGLHQPLQPRASASRNAF